MTATTEPQTGDLYPRPNRATIADRVNAQTTTPPGNNQEPDPRVNFARHLQARMRLLGWTQDRLQKEAGIKSPQLAARAVNGTGVDLALAGKIAGRVGLPFSVMIGPYECGTCHGAPPSGYRCLECETEGRRG